MNEVEFPLGIKLPSLGSNNEIVTIASDGTLVSAGTTIADVSGAPLVQTFFDAYDQTGGQTFTTGTVVLNLTERENSGQFTLSSNEITFNEDVDDVLIIASVSTDINSGSARSTSRFTVQLNTGSGYNEIAGMRGFMYNRTSGNGAATGSSQGVFSFNSGDKIRILVQRNTGSDTITTLANGSRITIVSAVPQRGPKGEDGANGDIVWKGKWSPGLYLVNDTVENDGSTFIATTNTTDEPSLTSTDWDLVSQKGDVGPTGSGSTITVFSDDSIISGSPFSILNFSSDFSVEQDISDSTQVNISTIVSSGTSFPSSPSSGQQFYRTDQQWQYTYDGSRSKWLGEIEWDGGGVNGNSGNDTYMRRFNGMSMSATSGIFIPYDITIVGISLANDNSVTGEMYVRRNGANVTGAFLDITTASQTGSDMTLNADFSSGGVMSLYWTNSSSTLNNPQVRVWWRRRGT